MYFFYSTLLPSYFCSFFKGVFKGFFSYKKYSFFRLQIVFNTITHRRLDPNHNSNIKKKQPGSKKWNTPF